MKEFFLNFPIIYRTYQKTVRIEKHEYLFFQYLFKNLKDKKLRVLDLCCGDSFILKFVNEYINDYLGVDNNNLYLNNSLYKWNKYKFINEDLNKIDENNTVVSFKPNIIFMHVAIHHLNDELVKKVSNLIDRYFKDAIFISVDPVIEDNSVINEIMIKFDRGKFIRERENYNNLLRNFESFIVDDFYRMSFKNIFHYRNVDIVKHYENWKKL